jgi:hypothetical protein
VSGAGVVAVGGWQRAEFICVFETASWASGGAEKGCRGYEIWTFIAPLPRYIRRLTDKCTARIFTG